MMRQSGGKSAIRVLRSLGPLPAPGSAASASARCVVLVTKAEVSAWAKVV